MSRRRKARRKQIAGGDRKTHSERVKVDRFHQHQVEAWMRFNRPERPYAAIATRKLRFTAINQLLDDRPPSVVRRCDGLRVYLFKDGEDRDLFVEAFHDRYRARAITIGAHHGA